MTFQRSEGDSGFLESLTCSYENTRLLHHNSYLFLNSLIVVLPRILSYVSSEANSHVFFGVVIIYQ